MKLIKKLFLLLLVNISATAFASDVTVKPDSKQPDTDSSNSNNTGTPTYDNSTGKSTYDNGTGKSTYDNGTGRLYDNGTGKSTNMNNTGTDANKITTTKPVVKPKKNRTNLSKKIVLQGVLPDENEKIIQFAKDAGATDANIDGNVLNIYGNNFNLDTFETWMADSIPGAKVQN